MRHGYIKTAAATPYITVADCRANGEEIIRLIREMEKEHTKVMVFPELCITGYTCQDLFLQRRLLDSAWEELLHIAEETKETDALIFVGIPFVVRAIQPVLEKLDGSYEEAARVMGAKPFTVFRRVILPEFLPAMLSGAGLAFGRCLGEYGSVVFIAGNKPYYTEITPLIIMSKLQEFDYESATAIALVTLAVSFLILFGVNLVQARNTKRIRGRDA